MKLTPSVNGPGAPDFATAGAGSVAPSSSAPDSSTGILRSMVLLASTDVRAPICKGTRPAGRRDHAPTATLESLTASLTEGYALRHHESTAEHDSAAAPPARGARAHRD